MLYISVARLRMSNHLTRNTRDFRRFVDLALHMRMGQEHGCRYCRDHALLYSVATIGGCVVIFSELVVRWILGVSWHACIVQMAVSHASYSEALVM